MCGFHGVLSNNSDKEYKDHDFASLSHRGPDDNQSISIKNLKINFFRLKILGGDLGAQPMYSDSKEWLIVFNGEIYNYKELAILMEREDLIAHGDTKVLIEFISMYGLTHFSKVNGMFSIALYNLKSETLYFIRDRFGIKPLFYQIIEGNIFFSSEIKSLFKKEISTNEIKNFINTGKYPKNELTFYKNIFEIKPGTITNFIDGKINEHKYYVLNKNISMQDARDLNEYEKIIEKAIEIRLRSDVPISIHFSGGVDSTALLIKVKEVAGWDYPIGVFHLSYSGFEQLDYYFAQKISDKLQIELNNVVLSPAEVPKLAKELQYFQDEPYGGIPSISMYKMNMIEREKGYVVSLEGQGGDEALGGYLSHIVLAIKDMIDEKENHSLAKELCNNIGLSLRDANLLAEKFITSGFNSHTDLTDNKNNYSEYKITKILNWLLTVQLFDTLENKIPRTLRFHDRISAACSRELRFPFLDYNVMEYGIKLDRNIKYKDGIAKYPFKRIIHRYLPQELFSEVKRADSTPQTYWLKNDLKYWVDKNLDELKEKNIVDISYIEETSNELEFSNLDNSFKVWQLINLNLIDIKKKEVFSI